MKFTDTLKELEAKATNGKWTVVDCRPEGNKLFLTDGFSVVCRIQNSVSSKPLENEDEANAELIAFLRNHAKKIINLVEAAEDLEAVVNPESDREKAAWWKLKVTLAALNKDK